MPPEPLRRVGRPDQQASEILVRHIVNTATRLFIEQGYPATSIEQIATAAGSGKQTIYRHFASKEALFLAVINRHAGLLIEEAARAVTTCADPVDALKESCRLFFEFVHTADVIRLERILVAEAGRFPDLGERVLDSCLTPIRDLMNRLLDRAAHEGRVLMHDPSSTHILLIGLLTGWPTQQALLGQQPFESAVESETYFEAAWALFLRGVA